MSKLKSCGVLVVRGKPPVEFLLMIHPDRLDLPKGHVDPGESELQCALRELEEETGITAEDIELDPTFRFTTAYKVWQKKRQEFAEKITVVFLGFLTRDVEIRVTEHVGYDWRRWAPPHQIQPETIDPLLARLQRHLADNPPS